MAKDKTQPKHRGEPADRQVRIGADPDSYRKERPVWRFKDFDWDGPWGTAACLHSVTNMQKHIQMHLSSFETMTWEEILRASGAKKTGNLHHEISIGKFSKIVRERLKAKEINVDNLFSFRFDQCTRLYGVREGSCLRLVFFDPHHCEKDGRSAYQWQ